MRFVVVRNSEPGCEPVCAEWISAEGAIFAKTPGELKRLLKTLGGRKLPVVLFSPGGDVDAAMALGRMIRQNKLDTAVGATRFLGCQPADKDCTANDGKGAHLLGTAYANGSFCNSACPLVLAGGVHVRRAMGIPRCAQITGVRKAQLTIKPNTGGERQSVRSKRSSAARRPF